MSRIGYYFGALRFQAFLETELPELPECATEYFNSVLAGDEGKVDALVSMFHDSMRGRVAWWIYLRYRAGECSQGMHREALNATWNHTHRALRDVNRNILRAMFRHAGFPTPVEAPPIIDIWRGVTCIPLRIARRGISWTTNRDVACWFAITYERNPKGDPLVLGARVPKEKLVFLPNDRNEYEVICFDTGEVWRCGTPQDWREAGDRQQAA
jgi:hypothetical protein